MSATPQTSQKRSAAYWRRRYEHEHRLRTRTRRSRNSGMRALAASRLWNSACGLSDSLMADAALSLRRALRAGEYEAVVSLPAGMRMVGHAGRAALDEALTQQQERHCMAAATHDQQAERNVK